MDGTLITWWVLAAAAVACAVGMIAVKNPVHSALLLVGNFIAVAVIYLLLSAPMLFAIQLIVYAGAIMVLFLFVIMFFMAPSARQWQRPPLRSQIVLGGILTVAFIAALFIAISAVGGAGTGGPQTIEAGEDLGAPRAIGIWMFTYQALPFNVIGLLLLAALVGAVMVGRDRVSEGRAHVPEFAPHIDRVVGHRPQDRPAASGPAKAAEREEAAA
jgi:NADH-quinone oxidoreductase subunit J